MKRFSRPAAARFSSVVSTWLVLWIFAVWVKTAAAASPEAQAVDAAQRETELVRSRQPFPLTPELLSALEVWDKREFRALTPATLPNVSARVVLVHLWADWCGPCRDELPVWRVLLPELAKKYGSQLAVLFIAETTGQAELERFLDDQRARLPAVPMYFDPTEQFSKKLKARLRGSNVLLPVTLVLDGRREIRFAIVGSFLRKKAQLLEALEIPKLSTD